MTQMASDRDHMPQGMTRQFVSRLDIYLVLVLLVPFALIASNTEWLFPYGNPSDSWINKNYFFENGHDYRPLYEFYKSTRLSWIAKGYIVHAIFPPVVAHYVLHLTMFVLYISAFYFLIKTVFDRYVATITTMAFATYSQLHAVISFEWDYQTHDGVFNMVLTLLFMYIAATRASRWHLWLMAAGFTWLSAMQTTYMGTFIPATIFWCLYFNHKNQKHSIIKVGLWGTLGAAIALLFYCFVSLALGGPFLWFMTLVEPVLGFGYSGGFTFHIGYWQPTQYLFQISKGVILPSIATLVALGVILLLVLERRKSKLSEAMMASSMTLALCFAACIWFQVIGHGQLANDHIVAYIAPYAFIGIAAGIAVLFRTSGLTIPANRLWTVSLCIAAFCILTGTLVFGISSNAWVNKIVAFVHPLLPLPQSLISWRSVAALNLVIFILGIGFGFWLLHHFIKNRVMLRVGLLLTAITGLSLINIQTASIAVASYDYRHQCGFHKDQYQAVIDAFHRLKAHDNDRTLRVWYRNNVVIDHINPNCNRVETSRLLGKPVIQMLEVYNAIWGMRSFSVLTDPDRSAQYDYFGLVDRYQTTDSFSELSKGRPAKLPPVFRAAILARDPTDHEMGLNTLLKNGFRTEVLERSRIEYGTIGFDITIFEARKDDRLQAQSRR